MKYRKMLSAVILFNIFRKAQSQQEATAANTCLAKLPSLRRKSHPT
jgi:hypothetical protein